MNSATHNAGEAVPTNTDANIAVMAVEVRYIKESVERIERSAGALVTRTEWETRNRTVDGRFVDAFAAIATVRADGNVKIAELAADIAKRRAPWWTIVAAAAGSLAVIAYLFDIVPMIVN